MAGAAVNASPLIFLARLGRLEVLRAYKPLLTTDAVLREVKAGGPHGHGEAVPVSRLVKAGHLKVRRADLRAVEGFELDPGELSVLRAAEKAKVATVIVDDLAAIRAARHLGLEPRSTAFVLFDAATRRHMTRAEFLLDLDRLLRAGYYLGAPLYGFLREAAGRLEG